MPHLPPEPEVGKFSSEQAIFDAIKWFSKITNHGHCPQPPFYTKKNAMQKFLLPFLIIALFTACKKDEATDIFVDSPYPGVDDELQPYFQEFEAQAALRGIEVDLAAADVTGKIESLEGNGVAGQCTYGSHVADVVIDKEFWGSVPFHLVREMVVFHELGHCYLNRGHKEKVNADGTCASIMRSGLMECTDNYRADTRDEYLDELFSETGP